MQDLTVACILFGHAYEPKKYAMKDNVMYVHEECPRCGEKQFRAMIWDEATQGWKRDGQTIVHVEDIS